MKKWMYCLSHLVILQNAIFLILYIWNSLYFTTCETVGSIHKTVLIACSLILLMSDGNDGGSTANERLYILNLKWQRTFDLVIWFAAFLIKKSNIKMTRTAHLPSLTVSFLDFDTEGQKFSNPSWRKRFRLLSYNNVIWHNICNFLLCAIL